MPSDESENQTPQTVQVNLFTTENEYLGVYQAPDVPRVGEYVDWDDELYEVETVTWEGLPEYPGVQVRLRQ